jgi:hypothetical protein
MTDHHGPGGGVRSPLARADPVQVGGQASRDPADGGAVHPGRARAERPPDPGRAEGQRLAEPAGQRRGVAGLEQGGQFGPGVRVGVVGDPGFDRGSQLFSLFGCQRSASLPGV